MLYVIRINVHFKKQKRSSYSSSYTDHNQTVFLTMRLLLLLAEESKEGGLRDADDLETDSGNITDSVTGTTETSNKDFIVFINVIQATITRDESGDLLTVLNELDTNALTNSRVGLLSFNTTIHQSY